MINEDWRFEENSNIPRSSSDITISDSGLDTSSDISQKIVKTCTASTQTDAPLKPVCSKKHDGKSFRRKIILKNPNPESARKIEAKLIDEINGDFSTEITEIISEQNSRELYGDNIAENLHIHISKIVCNGKGEKIYKVSKIQ